MWFRKIDYPRVQTYVIPYITEIFYAGSVILIALLALLNIAIVGNDVVTELKKNPNNTDTKWWAPSWLPESMSIPTTPGPCQPLNLPQHATSIRTNSTLPVFSYTLLNGLGKSQNGSAKWYDSLPYRSEPLQDCVVENITALINLQDRGHKLTSQITCKIHSDNPDTPPVLKLSTSFSRMANTDLGSDDIVDYISSYAIPGFSDISKAQSVLLDLDAPALKMLGVLDAVGSDILKQLWAQKWYWKLSNRDNQWPDQAVIKWSNNADCTGDGDRLRRCRSQGKGIEGIDTWYSNTRGSQDWSAGYFGPMNTTLYNYFVVMRDALHLDLGNLDMQNNVFLNEDAFKANILPDPFMNITRPRVVGVSRPPPNRPGAYSATEFWRTCTWGWGCHNGTWTEAILNKAPAAVNITIGLPLKLVGAQYSTVIDVDYVCPVFRAKQGGQLFVSVFIGTFSMYTALFGVFAFIMPALDERYRKKHGIPREDHDEEYGNGRLAYQFQTLPQSADPYTTIFDASELRHNSTDTVPRYDPIPEHTFRRASQKGSPILPPGAYIPTSTIPSSDGPLPPISQVNTLTQAHSQSPSIHMASPQSALPGYFDPSSLTGTATVSESRSSQSAMDNRPVVIAAPPASATPVVENPERIKSFTASVIGGPGV